MAEKKYYSKDATNLFWKKGTRYNVGDLVNTPHRNHTLRCVISGVSSFEVPPIGEIKLLLDKHDRSNSKSPATLVDGTIKWEVFNFLTIETFERW